MQNEGGIPPGYKNSIQNLKIQTYFVRKLVKKKKIYIAEPPYRLRQFLETKKNRLEKYLEEFQNVLPDLQSLYKTDLKPMIKFGEGKEEMENIYKKYFLGIN